ncbi:hypothetical protein FACS1894172_17590 [Spirochaetia bacterium]|nr:hypothetical protein FACS1894164_04510 [Spirochaetia bacterium]GHU35593.1 hypothetical protein FACS1894172_17590 [Spirochaetia bacterium]
MKVRIYPTNDQRIFLNKTLGCYRLIYNLMFDDRIIMYNFLKDDLELLHAFQYKAEYDFLCITTITPESRISVQEFLRVGKKLSRIIETNPSLLDNIKEYDHY